MNFQLRTNLNFRKFISARRGSAFPAVSAFQVSGSGKSGSRTGVSGLPLRWFSGRGCRVFARFQQAIQPTKIRRFFWFSERILFTFFGVATGQFWRLIATLAARSNSGAPVKDKRKKHSSRGFKDGVPGFVRGSAFQNLWIFKR